MEMLISYLVFFLFGFFWFYSFKLCIFFCYEIFFSIVFIEFQMSDNRTTRIEEYLPTQGLLYFDEQLKYVISKPKIMPLKSLTLEKVLFKFFSFDMSKYICLFQLETLQNDAQEKLKQQEKLGVNFTE